MRKVLRLESKRRCAAYCSKTHWQMALDNVFLVEGVTGIHLGLLGLNPATGLQPVLLVPVHFFSMAFAFSPANQLGPEKKMRHTSPAGGSLFTAASNSSLITLSLPLMEAE